MGIGKSKLKKEMDIAENTRFQSNDELTRIEEYECDEKNTEVVKKEMYNNRWIKTIDLCKSTHDDNIIKSVVDDIIKHVMKMNM